MKLPVWLGLLSVPLLGFGEEAVSLPAFTVHSPRVAIQAPAAAMTMPVSVLRFEPQVDIHSRNLAEGQADVTVRGGIFENTGFQVGGSTLMDPQTGHYFAEIPIAPNMLQPPEIVTGAGLALGPTNATTGGVQYQWRRIETGGLLALGVGENGFIRGEVYQGLATGVSVAGLDLGADIALGHSESRGPVVHGDHAFDRIGGRLQLSGASGQTDLYAGYQAKFFGWPNLYTPFNSNETENLQTVLLSLNHRSRFQGGDFFEVGGYYRRNKDDYAFDRFAPLGPVHPFQHTTWVRALALSGRRSIGDTALNLRAEVLADELQSTSLTSGRYRTRAISRVGVVPEHTWTARDGARVTLRAGASFDDTNRDDGSISPVFEMARETGAGVLRRVHVSYVGTTQVPTYTALNSSSTAGLFRGNAALGRERSRNLEFGATGNWSGWVTQGAVFWRRDDALVDWTFRRGVTARTANPVDLDVVGLELMTRRSWSAGELVVGYTYLDKRADYRGAAVDASFYALNFARHRLTAALTIRLPLGFEVRMDNVLRAQAPNPLRAVGGDEALLSAVSLGYRPAGLPGFRVSLQADNLWDSDYQEVPAVPATPRQLALGLAYHW